MKLVATLRAVERKRSETSGEGLSAPQSQHPMDALSPELRQTYLGFLALGVHEDEYIAEEEKKYLEQVVKKLELPRGSVERALSFGENPREEELEALLDALREAKLHEAAMLEQILTSRSDFMQTSKEKEYLEIIGEHFDINDKQFEVLQSLAEAIVSGDQVKMKDLLEGKALKAELNVEVLYPFTPIPTAGEEASHPELERNVQIEMPRTIVPGKSPTFTGDISIKAHLTIEQGAELLITDATIRFEPGTTILVDGKLTLRGVTFEGTYGRISNQGGSVTVEECQAVTHDGGALFSVNKGSISIKGGTYGGGIWTGPLVQAKEEAIVALDGVTVLGDELDSEVLDQIDDFFSNLLRPLKRLDEELLSERKEVEVEIREASNYSLPGVITLANVKSLSVTDCRFEGPENGPWVPICGSVLTIDDVLKTFQDKIAMGKKDGDEERSHRMDKIGGLFEDFTKEIEDKVTSGNEQSFEGLLRDFSKNLDEVQKSISEQDPGETTTQKWMKNSVSFLAGKGKELVGGLSDKISFPNVSDGATLSGSHFKNATSVIFGTLNVNDCIFDSSSGRNDEDPDEDRLPKLLWGGLTDMKSTICASRFVNTGGGLYLGLGLCDPSAGEASVAESIFQNLDSKNGAGIEAYVRDSSFSLSIADCRFVDCRAEIRGGAVTSQSVSEYSGTQIKNCLFDNCSAEHGGAIAGEKISVDGCTFRNCSANDETAIVAQLGEVKGSSFLKTQARQKGQSVEGWEVEVSECTTARRSDFDVETVKDCRFTDE